MLFFIPKNFLLNLFICCYLNIRDFPPTVIKFQINYLYKKIINKQGSPKSLFGELGVFNTDLL
jgi:hypothetical protein